MTFEGKRVLILEDEGLIAMDLEDDLVDMGMTVVANLRRVDRALAALENKTIDIAILDVNLGSETSYPVAEALRERAIPFIFASGYGAQGIDEKWADVPVVQKPFSAHRLADTIATSLRPAARS